MISRQLISIFLLLSFAVTACISTPPPVGAYPCYDEPKVQGLSGTASAEPMDTSLAYVPNQMLIKYRHPSDTPSPAESLQDYQDLAAGVQSDYDLNLLEAGDGVLPDLVEIPAAELFDRLLDELNADPRVAYAEPNYYLHPLSTVPTDPYMLEQWHLMDFGLPHAWSVETGKESIVVAVIDTGFDLQHPDLQGRFLAGCDFQAEDSDPSTKPAVSSFPGPDSHGTHVAGIVAASANNNSGGVGVAYTGVAILPVKVFNDEGTQAATMSNVAKAIRWSAGLNVPGVNRNPHPAKIINLSFGSENPSSTLNDAVKEARNAGALIIAASGNDSAKNDTIRSPASSPDVVAVGSVNHNYQRSSFSNYSTTERTVDLMAPGGSGPSQCGYVLSSINGNAYDCMAGTSMAAPFVAGVAALVWSQNPDWSAEQVKQKLLASTYVDTAWNPQEYGAGVLCADRALGAGTLCGR